MDPDFDDENSPRMAFVNGLIERIKARLGATEIAFDDQEFEISYGGWRWRLHNLYDQYILLADAEVRARYLDEAVADMPFDTATKPFEEVREQLMPAVRDRILLLETDIRGKDLTLEQICAVEPSLPHRVIAPHYISLLAINSPRQIRYGNTRVFSEWGKTFEELMDVAMSNLRAASGDSFNLIAGGVYCSPWHDSLDCSRILLTDKIRAECEVLGEPVAFLSTRDNLFITGSEDVAGLLMLMDICLAQAKSPRALFCLPLVLRNDEWQLFQPPPEHKMHTQIKGMHFASLNAIYGDSQYVLEEIIGDDIYLAPFRYYTVKDDERHPFFSLAAWPSRCLMPRTEWVGFVKIDDTTGKGTVLGKARWEDVETAAKKIGEPLLPITTYPERYLLPEPLVVLDDLALVEDVSFPDLPVQAILRDERSLPELITAARERLMKSFRSLLAQRVKDGKGHAELQITSPEIEREYLSTHRRIDYVTMGDEGMKVLQIVTECLSMIPTSYDLPSGMQVLVKPFCWDAARFECDRFDQQSPAFREWIVRWYDPEESSPRDEEGFAGAIHSVMRPSMIDGITYLTIDFGSAPVEAMEQFFDVLYGAGAREVMLFSEWDMPEASEAS